MPPPDVSMMAERASSPPGLVASSRIEIWPLGSLMPSIQTSAPSTPVQRSGRSSTSSKSSKKGRVVVTDSGGMHMSARACATSELSIRVATLQQGQCVAMPMTAPLKISAEPELPPRRSTANVYKSPNTWQIVPLAYCWVCERTQVKSTPYPVNSTKSLGCAITGLMGTSTP